MNKHLLDNVREYSSVEQIGIKVKFVGTEDKGGKHFYKIPLDLFPDLLPI